jgi:hypothetical protein
MAYFSDRAGVFCRIGRLFPCQLVSWTFLSWTTHMRNTRTLRSPSLHLDLMASFVCTRISTAVSST